MQSIWPFTKSVYIVAFVAVITIGAIGCGRSETKGTGGAGGKAGSSGHAGTGDAGGTGGSGGSGGKGGSGDSGGSGGSGGKGGTGGTGGAGGADAAADASASKSDSGGIPSNTYTIKGDGTVTDRFTGLMWMRCAAGLSGDDCSEGSASIYTYQEAIDYCYSLDFAGHDDWRLPEIHELTSIVDYTKYDPAIDETAFPATPSFSSWSSSSHAYLVSNAWSVFFNVGYVNSNDKSNTGYVRCVRGGPLVIGSFEPSVISGDPIVKDTATGLTWQSCSAGSSGESCDQGSEARYGWQEAVDYCENLTWAGYSDWRLPEVHELISIVDYTKYNPAINETAFPAEPNDLFWSSSSCANLVSVAWGVYFNDGYVSSADKSNAYYVRCVRGGP